MQTIERRFKKFVACYNKKRKIPDWTFECITRTSVKENKEKCGRRKFSYKQDRKIQTVYRSKKQDYIKSGYDSGHIVAARNHQEYPSCSETFFLSNIAPQLSGFNNGVWKTLEIYTRNLKQNHERVYVFSGTLFLSEL